MKTCLSATAMVLAATTANAAQAKQTNEYVELILSTYGTYQIASEYPDGGYKFQVDASGFGGAEEGKHLSDFCVRSARKTL
jgi:hypothetical protein